MPRFTGPSLQQPGLGGRRDPGHQTGGGGNGGNGGAGGAAVLAGDGGAGGGGVDREGLAAAGDRWCRRWGRSDIRRTRRGVIPSRTRRLSTHSSPPAFHQTTACKSESDQTPCCPVSRLPGWQLTAKNAPDMVTALNTIAATAPSASAACGLHTLPHRSQMHDADRGAGGQKEFPLLHRFTLRIARGGSKD